MKDSSSSHAPACVIAHRIAGLLLSLGAVVACSDNGQSEQDRSIRARQMRDVSHMLDTMETPPGTPMPGSAGHATAPITPDQFPPSASPGSLTLTAWMPIVPWLALLGMLIVAISILLWRRRRAASLLVTPAPSIAGYFADTVEPSAKTRVPIAPLCWVYRRSSFETPELYMVQAPVDLLLPPTEPVSVARAGEFRDELTRIATLAGATRLFAMRDLVRRIDRDTQRDNPALIDLGIDAQLSWSGWLFGDAAVRRLIEAEHLCDRLTAAGPDAASRSLRRRGEIWLHRAGLLKPSDRLPALDQAQALLEDALAQVADPETALLIARTAQQRAPLLPVDAFGATCEFALVHAFMAEQATAWRHAALACRRDIQTTYAAHSPPVDPDTP